MNDEMRAKIAACETPEDILALAKNEGIELSDDQMEAVSGGSWDCDTFACAVSGYNG